MELHEVTPPKIYSWLPHPRLGQPCPPQPGQLSSTLQVPFHGDPFSAAKSLICCMHCTSCTSASFFVLVNLSTSSVRRYTRFFKSVISSSLVTNNFLSSVIMTKYKYQSKWKEFYSPTIMYSQAQGATSMILGNRFILLLQ